MKKIIAALFFLLPVITNALNIEVSTGSNSGKNYNIISIKDTEDIECVSQILAYDAHRYVCMSSAEGIGTLNDVNLNLVDIRYKKEEGRLFIVIIPKTRSKIYNTSSKLFNTEKALNNTTLKGKSFEILIDPSLDEFDPLPKKSLNFAPDFSSLLRPSIGALDLNKSPIAELNSNDIDAYLSIKKAFEADKFERVLLETDEALKRYPNSLFASEFNLLKMLSIDALLSRGDEFEDISYADIIKLAKAWLFNFPSDEAYSRVLYLLSKSYIKEGQLSDAGYTLDILLSEHKASTYSRLAQLDYADALYANGRAKDAIALYEEVLYNAKDIDTASRAALRLADTNIEKDKFDLAKQFVLKVLNANSEIFIAQQSKAISMAKAFKDKNMPDIAARIYESLLKNPNLNKNDDERILKDYGLTLIAAKESQKAYDALSKYKKDYPYGDYIEEVQKGLDGLLFDVKEADSAKLHEHYKSLIEKYQDGEIAQKAILADMKLSLEQKEYKNVLEYTQKARELKLQEGEKMLNKAALILAKDALKKRECSRVVNLVSNYEFDRLELAQFKLYDCFVQTARYADALALARAHKDDDSLIDRVEWLYRAADEELRAGDVEAALKASDDAISLGARIDHADVSNALFIRLKALLKLDKFNAAIQTINAIEQLKGEGARTLEAYDAVANYAATAKDFASSSTYSWRGIELAKKLGVKAYSPELDFIYATSLIRLSQTKDAVSWLKSMLATRLNPKDRDRAISLLGGAYLEDRQIDLAKSALNECANSNFESEFKAMCKSQLNILDIAK
ncbi:tetratricopeptide repeat protein [Campylobacter sp. 19-13652]|uniref:DUF7494 domain-containing protein n=1 Tax=Campylobacter sp. 19-13652 TaxID=2840180 RepID=UPI001C761CC5|nr:tetratricopeptide repeat protein [Campylobacter sp. 19-13652]BCX78743.1 paralyzed flagella protein PflA [Campylobacter sp. 19-13652]